MVPGKKKRENWKQKKAGMQTFANKFGTSSIDPVIASVQVGSYSLDKAYIARSISSSADWWGDTACSCLAALKSDILTEMMINYKRRKKSTYINNSILE